MNKRARYFYLAAILVIFVGVLKQIDYHDLSWSSNSGMYLTGMGLIMASILVVNNMINGKKDN